MAYGMTKVDAPTATAKTPQHEEGQSSSSSIITVDPTTLDEKEEAQLKEAIRKAVMSMFSKGEQPGEESNGTARI